MAYSNQVVLSRSRLVAGCSQDRFEGTSDDNCSPINRLFGQLAASDLMQLPIDSKLPDFVIYRSLQKYIMTPDRMETFGYPLPIHDEEDGRVKIPAGFYPTTRNYFNSNQRTCCRCKTVFQVREDGRPVLDKRCFYHRGQLKLPFNRLGPLVYSCCGREMSSLGCQMSESHVVDGSGHPDYDRHFRRTVNRQDDFVKTKDWCPGVYALDCEMCNTTIGIEVTKVTVVDWRLNVVYETLVKPSNPILDYNTVFSGIRAGDLDHVTTTLADVQDFLLELISGETIVVGHALRNDLKALKMLHMCVIDTEEVFPHPKGLPFTRSLKSIVEQNFDFQFQTFVHDSRLDAIACMNLMLRQVKPDVQDYEKAMRNLMVFR